VDAFRPSLEEGAARAGRSPGDLAVTPQVSLAIYDDVEHARNFMRPYMALYIGGMGSRDRNFYNQLVTRYGYGDAAREVQDLYLSGKQGEAMAAIPDELIDKVALTGSKEAIADRIDAYRDAGVKTLLVTPAATSQEDRLRMIRDLAEIAA
jgi:alkanesulfonate monooxygenase SsuD/methylene tetrahydromethanopterin reductase-like flavin-dependent oxidoreductase (luciferase family)